MIYDVLDMLDAELRDSTRGINARIAAVNTLKALPPRSEAPQMKEILTWDLKKLPSEMKMPTVQLVWNGSRDMQVQSQGKWRGSHLISLNFWTDKKASSEARRHVALWAHAVRLLVDDIPTNSALVDDVRDMSFDVAGWAGAGRLYTWMAYSFRLKERDEFPE